MFLTAVRRKSWKSKSGTPAAFVARFQLIRKSMTRLASATRKLNQLDDTDCLFH